MMNKPKELPSADIGRRKKKNDTLLILGLLLILCLTGIFYFFGRDTGDTAVITVDGERFGEYALNENRTVEIRTQWGVNVLVIADGKAYMETADCPDGICKAHRPIFRDGETIVCLPHKVIVTVYGEESA